jgi:hypothetical protein
MANEPVIKVTMELRRNGVKRVVGHADSPEGRDEGLERLRSCLVQLEMLEQALQSNVPEVTQSQHQ